jgi:AP-4 complex subunit epsilon-1
MLKFCAFVIKNQFLVRTNKLKMSSGSHLSKELLDLVKSIGESRSKQEEDKIITAEAQILKQKFNERNMPEKKLRELLIRAIYVEMLGHDASFAHIHAVNLT